MPYDARVSKKAKAKGKGKDAAKAKVKPPKKKCCDSEPKCRRCPLRMLNEGTLPAGYDVKHRRLVRIDGLPLEDPKRSKKKRKKDKKRKREARAREARALEARARESRAVEEPAAGEQVDSGDQPGAKAARAPLAS